MCLTLPQDTHPHCEKKAWPACWRLSAHLDQRESAQLSQLRLRKVRMLNEDQQSQLGADHSHTREPR